MQNSFQSFNFNQLSVPKKENDPRLINLLTEISKNENSANLDDATKSYYFAGYPDDDGIALNQGRLGASKAPLEIRKAFYKMTTSPWSSEQPKIHDIGDLNTKLTLAERHQAVKDLVCSTLAAHPTQVWCGMGGGHDYGYPDAAGFLLSQKENNKLSDQFKPLVINFDAHLDVRPLDAGLSSGTPFYRLLTDESLPDFDFFEIGIQAHCNSKEHYEWAQSKKAHIINLTTLQMNGLVDSCLDRLKPFMITPRPTFLSVDIDAFSSAVAPGCSQSWGQGLEPNSFMKLLQILKARLDIRGLSVYEVSPALDTDNRTSKLAAEIFHSLIF